MYVNYDIKTGCPKSGHIFIEHVLCTVCQIATSILDYVWPHISVM